MSIREIEILLIEDNPGDSRLILEMMKESLNVNYNVAIADSISAAESVLDKEKYDLILLDLNLPDSNGISTLTHVLNKTVNIVPVIVLTGLDDENIGISSIELGAEDYLVKGVADSLQLLRSIRYALERKRIKIKFQESERKYRELMENANSIIIRWKNDGEILFINEYALQLFGYKNEEITGRHVNIIVPDQESGPSGNDLSTLVLDIAADPEKYKNVVNENICKDGSRVWVMWTNKPVYDDNGKLLELLAVGLDITEKKHADDLLQAQLDELRRWQDVTLDRESRIIELKQEVNKLLVESGKEKKYSC